MGDQRTNAARLLAGLALLGLVASCGGRDDEDSDDGVPREDGVAEDPVAAPPTESEPRPLELGRPPSALSVPIPPSLEVTVTRPGEYQIDAVGAPMDPEIYLYRGDQLIETNNDGGEALNARIVRFLDPGTYSVRVLEHRARGFTAQMSARRLEPLTPVGTITVGTPLAVQFPSTAPLERPRNDRDAARAVTLSIDRPGRYTCTAEANNGRDAKMAILGDGRILAEDDDSGRGDAASITRDYDAGTYVIRVWDWIRRGEMIITVECHEG